MKTVSTKLSKEDFERFQEMCNHDGQCMSENLRDLIKMGIGAYEEGLEMEKEESKTIIANISKKPSVISHGKLLNDNGNVIGTF